MVRPILREMKRYQMKQLLSFSFFILLGMGSLCFGQVSLTHLGSYATGIFDEGAAEIAAFDSASKRLFVVNGSEAMIDILDISNPSNPNRVARIDVTIYGGNANSVACKNGFLALAVEDSTVSGNGKVVFYTASGTYQSMVTVGVLPDMVTFSPDGNWVMTANEGEPADDYSVDPLGSVSIIDISGGIASLTNSNVTTLDFSAFNGASLDPSIRIFGNGGASTVAQDMEPEYIAISPDSKKAYVTCQENNALAIIDIPAKSILGLKGLGYKDHSQIGFGMDASDDAAGVNIAAWPVMGMYLPDAISAFRANGSWYLITANEGDARAYSAYNEETRVKSISLDPTIFPNASFLQNDTVIGRLRCTNSQGDIDNDGDYDRIYTFGARSFTIWDSTGALVYDSGDDLEQQTYAALPSEFNSNNDDNTSFKSRSDDKGPEPEAVTVAELNGRVYAFVGMERIGGVAVYDVTVPSAPVFMHYSNNRNFAVDADSPQAGDLGPEGLLVIPASQGFSNHLLVTANEISGTVSIFSIDVPTSVQGAVSREPLVGYPNPAGNTLYLSRPVAGRILDLQGRVVAAGSGSSFSLVGLAPGMYLFQSESGEYFQFLRQ